MKKRYKIKSRNRNQGTNGNYGKHCGSHRLNGNRGNHKGAAGTTRVLLGPRGCCCNHEGAVTTRVLGARRLPGARRNARTQKRRRRRRKEREDEGK